MGIITGTFGDDKIRGGDGIDIVLALGGNDVIYGGGGLDTIDGGDGNDTIYACDNDDWSDGALNVLTGGAGDDKIFAGLGDVANGGTGFDVLSLDLSSSAQGLTIDFRPLTLLSLGGLGELTLDGALLSGFEAIGTVIGTEANDVLTLRNQNRVGSTVLAGGGDDTIRAGNGADDLRGGDGHDTLFGGKGSDTLGGGDGDDRLMAGTGGDTLTGGAGADTFVFKTVDDSAASRKNADVITDFSHADGDKISLKGIDAVSATETDNRFQYVGHDAFSGTAGELRSVIKDGITFVAGDVDGDGQADFSIQLNGELNLVASDFVL